MNKPNPNILHIDLGNQSLQAWLIANRYIIYSELVRFSEKLLKEDLDAIEAVLVSNLSDNVVFVLEKKNIHITLEKAMAYFLEIEEYEKCSKIRDLQNLL